MIKVAAVLWGAGIIAGCAGAAVGIYLGLKKTADAGRRRWLKHCILTMVAACALSIVMVFLLPFKYKFYMWLPYPFAFLYVILYWARNKKV